LAKRLVLLGADSYETCDACDEYTAVGIEDERSESNPFTQTVMFWIVVLFAAVVVAASLRRIRIHHTLRTEAYGLRLRYLNSNRPAEPAVLHEPLRFHLFLSHVWTTGANQMRISKERLKLMCPDLKVFLGMPPRAQECIAGDESLTQGGSTRGTKTSTISIWGAASSTSISHSSSS
jgi:hypothetical protein